MLARAASCQVSQDAARWRWSHELELELELELEALELNSLARAQPAGLARAGTTSWN
jgi:hypothetical protein